MDDDDADEDEVERDESRENGNVKEEGEESDRNGQ